MEGVVFETKTALTDLKTHGCNVDRLRIMGGASKSRVWSGIIAAVTGCQTSCQTSCMKEPEAWLVAWVLQLSQQWSLP